MTRPVDTLIWLSLASGAWASACQGTSGEAPAAGSATTSLAPGAIEARSSSGAVVARIVPGHPCRATVDGVELLVGTAPIGSEAGVIVAQVGAVRWTGEVASNGTTFLRDDARVARMYAATADDVALIDPEGVAIMRAARAANQPDRLAIADRSGTVTRYVKPGAKPNTVEVVPDKADTIVVTGTNDLLLAAVLTATEASAEVRGLSACHRLFPIEKVQ
ncbi:MAG: hypothetical protein NT062_29865 [Proteobacteria bacterium]|nr:hypothetical protein [Pseudomonadota bacterium]